MIQTCFSPTTTATEKTCLSARFSVLIPRAEHVKKEIMLAPPVNIPCLRPMTQVKAADKWKHGGEMEMNIIIVTVQKVGTDSGCC